MQLTETEILHMARQAQARAMDIFYIRQAAKRGDRDDPHHPDSIRKRMAQQQSLLDEAGV